MKRTSLNKGIAVFTSLLLAVSTCFCGDSAFFGIKSFADEKAASVNATNLNVRSGPGTSYASVARLSYGSSVTVVGEQKAADGVLWYQIRFSGSGGAQTTGYVSGQYIKFPTAAVANDGNFETYMARQGFPESYKPGLRQLHAEFPNWTFTAYKTNLDWNTVIDNESVIGRNLVARSSVSSWKSTAAGAYDWNTSTWPGFDGSSWVQASGDIVRFYMDPRNFLNDKYVYQFMKQSYNSSLHTREGLVGMVSGTFLSGNAQGNGAPSGSSTGSSGSQGGGAGGTGTDGAGTGPGTGPGAAGPGDSETGSAETQGAAAPVSPLSPVASISSHQTDLVMTSYGPGMGSSSPGASDSGSSGALQGTGSSSYVDIIMNAAVQSGVNPYILASMILQEQGNQGTGSSISGTVSGYEGYYNFFNIESYQSGSLEAVERGLWWASQSGSYNRPWNSAENAILGGAAWYGNNYVKQGQDTLYLKKFNVQGSNLYKHQYMTNVQAAASEGANLSKVSSLKNVPLEFSIPVYNNMPDTACAQPAGDGSPNNKLFGLGVEGFAVTPTFNRDTESYDLIVDNSVESVTVAAAALDSAASVGGTGKVNLQSGINDITISVKAGNGAVRNYVIHVFRQAGGPTYSDSIGSGVTSGAGTSTGAGSGAGPGGGPGTSSGGQTNPGTGSANDGSSVEIIGPPGSSSGSGQGTSGGPIAPDGSGVNGFGTEEDGSGIKGPLGTGFPGGSSAPGENIVQGQNTDPGGTAGGNSQAGSAGAAQNGYQKVTAGVTAAELCARLEISAAGGLAKVYASDSREVTASVGTGNLLVLYGSGGEPISQYEIVVKGDNTGDGKINILDVLKAQRDILGMERMTGALKEATDVNENQKIDITDILAMQKDILGIQKLQ